MGTEEPFPSAFFGTVQSILVAVLLAHRYPHCRTNIPNLQKAIVMKYPPKGQNKIDFDDPKGTRCFYVQSFPVNPNQTRD